MVNVLNIPSTPTVNPKSGYLNPEWRLWLTSPTFLAMQVGAALGANSGGTGSTATPAVGVIAVGDGVGYTPTTTLPVNALPALTGDISTPAGSAVTTLATVNASVGGFGSSTKVGSFVVNAKGLITAANEVSITGAVGAFTVVGAFGCNGKTAQTATTINSAIAATAGATYTGTEQTMLNDIKALLNQIRAALIANGITV